MIRYERRTERSGRAVSSELDLACEVLVPKEVVPKTVRGGLEGDIGEDSGPCESLRCLLHGEREREDRTCD